MSAQVSAGGATLIYDGECGFCRRWVARVRRWDRRRLIAWVPHQASDLEARFPGVSRAACTQRIHLVDAGGRVYAGAAAGREVLRRLPHGWLWALPFQLPGALRVAEPVYAWIARRWGPVDRRRRTADHASPG